LATIGSLLAPSGCFRSAGASLTVGVKEFADVPNTFFLNVVDEDD
jgi:hypothetical protein